jgi:UDP-N-acetylmuramate--alanine ligase
MQIENFNFKACHLVGIKGVGMTSLAQILLDAGAAVTGCDVAEDFVTKKILDRLGINIIEGFDKTPPSGTDAIIYSAAHSGKNNPQVMKAVELGLPIFSHAEILGYFFNLQKGVAVCGVGGKSSTSAMIVWIMSKLNMEPSFSVGVGEIIGLEKTGQLNKQSKWFVAEADEFVMDPSAPSRGEQLVPRFMTMLPFLTVSKELIWDHPDVYPTEGKYLAAFEDFFGQIDENGSLIYQLQTNLPGIKNSAKKEISYQEIRDEKRDLAKTCYQILNGVGQSTQAKLWLENTEYHIKLNIPGRFNIDNAVAAILACKEMGIAPADSAHALESFQSTTRRVEKIGEKNGVMYYDDYAHHPHELSNVISSFQEWFAGRRIVIAFQPHTYSRTKELFDGFIASLSTAKELLLLDIFASARESVDPEVSSLKLVNAIKQAGHNQVTHLASVKELAEYCLSNLQPNDVLLTIGAGDIYQVHEMI